MERLNGFTRPMPTVNSRLLCVVCDWVTRVFAENFPGKQQQTAV